MILKTTKTLEDLRPVLKDPQSNGPEVVYWVFGEVTDEKWANITIWTTEKIGEEYPKTYGHYHGAQVDETYHVVEGEGVMQLQKKHMENGEWVQDQVDEVLLVKAKAGDELIIKPEYGHSWSNIGKTPLITYDNWTSGHTPADYEHMEKLKGLAYYLVGENGEVKTIPNQNYKNLPEPIWMTVEEFKNR